MVRVKWLAVVWSTLLCGLSHAAAQTVAPAAVVTPQNPPPALAWDADMKAFKVKEGQTNFQFSFSVTNVSQSEVTIRRVHPSCGCTLVKLPAQPWTLAPGAYDSMEVAVDLRGKFGTLVKNILVDSTAGFKTLVMKIEIPGQPPMLSSSPMISRAQNIRVALVDRQAVFKGDCARCHAAPAAGKSGQALYQAVCAICHDTPHRASMVPDLRQPKTPRDTNFWQLWITVGKEGTLMPAFSSKADSGPLSDPQISSLVEYLDKTYPKTPVPVTPLPAIPIPVVK